jgi:hypothetical protein
MFMLRTFPMFMTLGDRTLALAYKDATVKNR